MKTYRNLYPQICSFENIYLAYRAARKGKRGRVAAASFELDQEEGLLSLQEELQRLTYRHGPYHSFYIHDPKKRLISAADFRDRIVHHALCRVIEPIWEGRFISDSYANRTGKGTHRALDQAQFFSRRYPYVLQCDIRQFFPSIDHAILRAVLAWRIADQKTLWLIDQILESGVGVLSESYDMVYFPQDASSEGTGEGLFAALRPRGLPIGNLTSQFWANVYLNSLDHFIKRDLKCHGYLRYVDDFLLFSHEKRELWQWRKAVIEHLAGLRLTLHERSALVYPVTTGVPFLGFRIFPTHRRVKRRKVVAFSRKLRILLSEVADAPSGYPRLRSSILGWINHVKYADSWGLRRSILSQPIPGWRS
jgi:RNA-directed DNA polymerase